VCVESSSSSLSLVIIVMMAVISCFPCESQNVDNDTRTRTRTRHCSSGNFLLESLSNERNVMMKVKWCCTCSSVISDYSDTDARCKCSSSYAYYSI